MGDFKRRRGESASGWYARLGDVNMADLSPLQLDELTLRRVLAVRALRREGRSRLRRQAALADEANGGPKSADLRRCMEVVRALSAEDRRRLVRWVETTLDE